MLWRYVKYVLEALFFPKDSPSPALAIVGTTVNGVLLLSTSAGWNAADHSECTTESRNWLIAGAINSALNIVFAILIVAAVRWRVNRCTSVEGLSAAGVVLKHPVVYLYGVIGIWEVVWIAVAYRRFPAQSCADALPPATGRDSRVDVCCVMDNVVSSVHVFYLCSAILVVGCTLVTERFEEPRWIHTLELRDIRRRELEIHYEEERREKKRPPSNADTDAEMIRCGVMLGSSVKPVRPLSVSRQRTKDDDHHAIFHDVLTSAEPQVLRSNGAKHPSKSKAISFAPLPNDAVDVDEITFQLPAADAPRERSSRDKYYVVDSGHDDFGRSEFYDVPNQSAAVRVRPRDPSKLGIVAKMRQEKASDCDRGR